MTRNRIRLVAAVGTCAVVAALATHGQAQPAAPHVILISVDGLHQVDVVRWIAGHPTGPLAMLASRGITYTNAYTPSPSDSFPGLLAQITGGTPKSTGVYYDETFDRAFYPPNSNCSGKPGAKVDLTESITKSLADVASGGTLGQPLTQIDTNKLPMRQTFSGCATIFPHDYLRVNTVFEVIRAHGLRTAWADKHPAYEILNGPSGHGVDDLYTPEINAQFPGAPEGKDYTSSFRGARDNDGFRLAAVLNQIDGKTSTGAAASGPPALFGMNFQAVSVGQKLAKAGFGDDAALVGGYAAADGTPGSALALQLQFVDDSIGTIASALKSKGLYDETTIIVSAKHGQSPIDPTLIHRIKNTFDKVLANDGFAFAVADDGALIWLDPLTRTQASAAAALQTLQANKAALGIDRIIDDPALAKTVGDTRTPDFVVVSSPGIIYTGGSKLAEHGGVTEDDQHVALIVSAAHLSGARNQDRVSTAQIAPTILQILRLTPAELEAVKIEGTTSLPGSHR